MRAHVCGTARFTQIHETGTLKQESGGVLSIYTTNNPKATLIIIQFENGFVNRR